MAVYVLLLVGVYHDLGMALATSLLDPAVRGWPLAASKDLGILLAANLPLAIALCARALGLRAVLWGITGMVPRLNIGVLLAVNQIAFNRLKAAAVKLGLLGARVPDRPPETFQPCRLA